MRDVRRQRAAAWTCCVSLCAAASPAAAQTQPHVQMGVQFVAASSSQFDATDTGVSVGVTWRPSPRETIGPDVEVAFYPKGFPDAPAFSSSRIEALFGVSGGPRLRNVRPIAKVKVGFLTYHEAPEPFACITIFPPPLQCVLAGGKTVPAIDLGGGLEIYPTVGTFVRVDVSDRALRYPGTVLDLNQQVRNDSFFSHDLRIAIGGGVRFR
jgi:hypothetical protein